MAATRCRNDRRARKARERNRVRRRLSTRAHASHRPRKTLLNKRSPPLLRGLDVSTDVTDGGPQGYSGLPENGNGHFRPTGVRLAKDVRPLLSQGDELSASSQVVWGGTSQLSRSASSFRGVRDLLSLRA